MSATPDIVRGRVDAAGRLVEADPLLETLNTQCGGEPAGLLAVPALTPLVRLSQRLGVLISRAVTVADHGRDIDLWVRAFPEDGGVRLALSGWQTASAWTPPAAPRAREVDFVTTGSDWTWEVDAALRLTHVDPRGRERHDLPVEELLGAAVTRLFALDEGEDGALPILEAAASRCGFTQQRARVRADGAMVTLSGAARTAASGAFAGFVGGVRVDARVMSPEAGLAAAASGDLERLLRRPLGSIIAKADSIHQQEDGPLAPDYVDYAADIASAGRHLLGLVDDLADLHAIERDDFALAPEPIDLADVARRAAGLLAVRAADRSVTIDRPGPADALPASGDFRRALQVMVNLVGNAVRYSPAGSTVWIRLQDEGERVVAIVADQGKGIAAHDQARIFDKFERVDPSEPGGTGLGLYIARRLARAMGGDLLVDSAAGQGARFLFVLPAG